MGSNKLKGYIYNNVKGWHLIGLGALFVGFGIFSILKIENSHSYSLKFIIGGIVLLISGVSLYIFK